MDRQKSEQINKILDKALDVDPSQRKAYLANLPIDIEIRKEVETLLAFDSETDPALDLSAVELSKDFINTKDESVLTGKQFGSYEIEEELGYGGMGAVYLAKRIDEKFDQKVAIKMLRQEFNTEKIRERFQKEREIQAALVHPNVATLIDAGTTDYGVPYLVMEYVEGIRIDQYCFENELDLNERLKLFNKVCDAIIFAHRNLIVHRDIKPSNIIVNKAGEPKLLDFGISKVISGDAETTRTVTKLGAMTPEYASPEQVRGESVTTATDIYSLGVVLFKLLTGAMPFDPKDKSEASLLHEITNSKPTRPSEARAESSQSMIHNQRLLKGDLDNIILKSLRKEPERRYLSVDEFSADIWRSIDGLPVLARPSTASYRAVKFYKRNKIQVLAGLLVLFSLIAGIVVSLWQRNLAIEQAKIEETESKKSKAEEERAKKITKFMEKVISYANPGGYALGSKTEGEAKVIDVLKELSSKIESDFPDQPDVQAELHHKFAEIFVVRSQPKNGKSDSDNPKKAKYHATRAIELRKKYYGEKHELVAKDMFYLWSAGGALSGDSALNPKLLAEAIQMMRETNPKNLNLPYMLGGYKSRLYSEAYGNETHEDYYRNALPKPTVERMELAENYAIEALSIFQTHYPDDSYAIDYAQCDLARIQINRAKFIEADNNFKACDRHITPKASYKTKKSYENYKRKLQDGLSR